MEWFRSRAPYRIPGGGLNRLGYHRGMEAATLILTVRPSRLLAGAHVLIVGEGQEFAAEGGMIAFVLSEGKIAFHINQASVERSGLKASAKLLQLAKLVHSEKR